MILFQTDELEQELMDSIEFLRSLGTPENRIDEILRAKLVRIAARAETELTMLQKQSIPSLN